MDLIWRKGWPEIDGYYWAWDGEASRTPEMIQVYADEHSFSWGEAVESHAYFLTYYGFSAGPLLPPSTLPIPAITLKLTCDACPEQYDAFDEHGTQVGYLRLRYGLFTVECPDVDGKQVYLAQPHGDGAFEDDERERYLGEATVAIQRWMMEQRQP